MLSKLSFQTKLFVMYSLLVLVVIPLSFTAFYVYYKDFTYNTMTEAFQREADNLSQQIDNTIFTADRLLLQLKYNPSIKDTFYYSLFSPDPKLYFKQNESVAYAIENVINSITGIDPQMFNRISIISKAGAFVGVGAYYDHIQAERRITELSWFRDLQDDLNYRVLLPPHRDDWDPEGRTVISLIRKVDSNNTFHSLIELQLPYASIQGILSSGTENKEDGKRVLLFGPDGQLIFPLAAESDGTDTRKWEPYAAAARDAVPGPVILQADGQRKEMAVFHHLHNSGWILVVVQPLDELLGPIRKTGYFMMAIALLMLALSIATVYYSTHKVVSPLVELSQTMSQVHIDARKNDKLEQLFTKLNAGEPHNEVVHLYHSFRKMLDRLDESKQEAVQAYSRELRSHFLALQAQMNPHFLYNTLSLIGMLGRESGNEEILEMTSLLVQMFRYITYSNGEQVTMQEEIDHTINYLRIMESRYSGHLHYSIRFDSHMECIRIPKLTIQPFVENCIKHGFNKKKYPWEISISGTVEGDKWSILIEDDGMGFDGHFLKEFEHKKHVARLQRHIPENHQANTGMINTYARFYYLFGERLVFETFNNSKGGASIRLGATIGKGEADDDESVVS
jgi:two-component system sensor histidine kinase YesM